MAYSADSTLVLNEPELNKEPGKVRLQVSNDGLTHLHLKWSGEGTAHQAIDLLFSQLKAEGQPPAVAVFDDDRSARGLWRPSRQHVDVSASGTEIPVAALLLAPGMDYQGYLYATVDNRKTQVWEITLQRPAVAEPFRCPSQPQIVSMDGSTNIDFETSILLDKKAVGLRLSTFISKDQEAGDIGFAGATRDQPLQRALSSYPVEGQHFMPPIRANDLTQESRHSSITDNFKSFATKL